MVLPKGCQCNQCGFQKQDSMAIEFKKYSNLLGVIRTINGTHFSFAKPICFVEDFYYFKTNDYNLVCQAMGKTIP